MATLAEISDAALRRDSLRLRSLVLDLLAENPVLSGLPKPATGDARTLSIAAAIVEMLALRRGQAPPGWAREVGPLAEPFFLVAAAESMPRLRRLCEQQAPEPMRRRRLYAPANFLASA